MKGKCRILLRACLFLGIVVLLFFSLNKLFQPVWFDWNNYYTVEGFYEEPDDTIEVLFLGASIVVSGII